MLHGTAPGHCQEQQVGYTTDGGPGYTSRLHTRVAMQNVHVEMHF